MGKIYLEDQVPKPNQSCRITDRSYEHQELEFNQKASNRERFKGFRRERSPRKRSLGTHVWFSQRKHPGITSKSMNQKSLKNSSENHQKGKTSGTKDLAQDWEGRFHYEYLSQIRLQATHKNHKSWMAKSSNKERTLSSLPLTKSTPKWKSTPTTKPKRWLKFSHSSYI